VRGCYTRTGIRQFFKDSVPQVSEEDARRLIGKLWQFFLDLGIDAPGYKEDVWPAVIIEIDNPRSPTGKAGLNAEPCLEGAIVEVCRPVVVAQHIGVLREMRHEDVQVSIQIVVADADSHARLFHSIAAEGNAALDRLTEAAFQEQMATLAASLTRHCRRLQER